ncbi:hypothetical protein [Nostoc flagelliforme]
MGITNGTQTETETESSDAEIYSSGTQTENEEMCPERYIHHNAHNV